MYSTTTLITKIKTQKDILSSVTYYKYWRI